MTKRTNKDVPLRAVKPVYLLAAAGVSCLVCIGALRDNNLKMVELRNAVYAADKEGGDVSKALTELKYFVVSHMNTDLTPGRNHVYPPIQLKYTYERLVAAQSGNANNAQVYTEAQAYCEGQNNRDFSGRNRVPCIQEYVKTHGGTVPQAIPDSLYKFDFVSPKWSPDLAGWTAVSTVALVLAAIGLFVFQRVVAHMRSRRR